MKISVVVPSYCRPDDLKRCLESLNNQSRLPDEVVVVIRSTDKETGDYLADYKNPRLPIKVVSAEKPGQIYALNSGKSAASGDIICITDDDGAPFPDWIQRIEQYFISDESIGGVGGRDWVNTEGRVLNDSQEVVGIVKWFGKCIGGHHYGVGKTRDVEILKGANMSYRSVAVKSIQFDDRLLGKGAQVHNDLAFSLKVKKAGWRLIYDPEVAINHFIAPRESHEDRVIFNREAHFNAAYNETLILLEYLPGIRKTVFLLWCVLVGTSVNPGFLQLIIKLLKRDDRALERFKSTLNARYCGMAAYHKYKRLK